MGSGIGILIITGLFGKRIFSCAYFPNQRILNNLAKKKIIIDKRCYVSLSAELKFYADTIFIKEKLLTEGDIHFAKSLPRKKPFPIYQIHYKNENNDKIYIFDIENQPQKAIVKIIRTLPTN